MLQVRALFSATLPQGVEDLASSVLQNPLRLTVGPRNAPTSTVAQRLLFVGQQDGKMLGLRQLIAEGLTPPVLLFVSSKERAEAVHRCSLLYMCALQYLLLSLLLLFCHNVMAMSAAIHITATVHIVKVKMTQEAIKHTVLHRQFCAS